MQKLFAVRAAFVAEALGSQYVSLGLVLVFVTEGTYGVGHDNRTDHACS